MPRIVKFKAVNYLFALMFSSATYAAGDCPSLVGYWEPFQCKDDNGEPMYPAPLTITQTGCSNVTILTRFTSSYYQIDKPMISVSNNQTSIRTRFDYTSLNYPFFQDQSLIIRGADTYLSHRQANARTKTFEISYKLEGDYLHKRLDYEFTGWRMSCTFKRQSQPAQQSEPSLNETFEISKMQLESLSQ